VDGLEVQSLTPDGFFPTGDLGRFDEAGYLYLVGRRAEIIKTANGRKVALPALEAHFASAPGVDRVVIFGHGRPCLVALVSFVPGESPDSNQLANLIEERNALLPRHERLAGVLVLAKALSPAAGELTANLKLRRGEIEKKHETAIEELFRELSLKRKEGAVLVRTESLAVQSEQVPSPPTSRKGKWNQ
jgi:long-chain acyl-CoA synthetase